jgi:hypothetical protein
MLYIYIVFYRWFAIHITNAMNMRNFWWLSETWTLFDKESCEQRFSSPIFLRIEFFQDRYKIPKLNWTLYGILGLLIPHWRIWYAILKIPSPCILVRNLTDSFTSNMITVCSLHLTWPICSLSVQVTSSSHLTKPHVWGLVILSHDPHITFRTYIYGFDTVLCKGKVKLSLCFF